MDLKELENITTDCEHKTKTLLNDVFKNGFLNFDVKIKSLKNYMGSFKKDSVRETFKPVMFVNKNIDNIFFDYGIINLDKKKHIIVDTLLHEAGHLIFELISSDDNLNDKIKNEIDNLDKNYLLKWIKQEYKFLNKDIYNIANFDNTIEEHYEEYEYVREEIFAENFSYYIRIKENNLDYLNTRRFDFNDEIFKKLFDNNLESISKLFNSYINENKEYNKKLKLISFENKGKKINLKKEENILNFN